MLRHGPPLAVAVAQRILHLGEFCLFAKENGAESATVQTESIALVKRRSHTTTSKGIEPFRYTRMHLSDFRRFFGTILQEGPDE